MGRASHASPSNWAMPARAASPPCSPARWVSPHVPSSRPMGRTGPDIWRCSASARASSEPSGTIRIVEDACRSASRRPRCGRSRVERLMRRHRIRALTGRRFRPYPTDSGRYLAIAPNLMVQTSQRSLQAGGPAQHQRSSITGNVSLLSRGGVISIRTLHFVSLIIGSMLNLGFSTQTGVAEIIRPQ